MDKDLSVIIVSYNVSPFLKLCLYSVSKAIRKVSAEVFVVDNASSDDSVEMVRKCFPDVKLLVNDENLGFSAANNRAITMAQGKVILLLNPDTIIPEDTFEKLIAFYEERKDAAGLGARMIDGTGKYLPESKRGLPSSRDFLFKFSGMINLFPQSALVSRYYMGHLSSDKIWEVPVLAGAFLAFPQRAVKEIGLMDEDFFMYGEDIDYSYRLSSIGKNYFNPELKIIHFKGESTVKDHNYIERFYGAMLIFSKKHFFPDYSSFRRGIVTVAINSVKSVLKLITFSEKRKNSEQERLVEPVAFYAGATDGYEKVKSAAGFKEVNFVSDLSKLDVDKRGDSLVNIFFDLKTVSIAEIIFFMERNSGNFRFSFVSPDRDFYLYSDSPKFQGEVVTI